MSGSSQNNSARVTELQQSITTISACYSYEWLTTFDQEVNHIWARKWTLSTFIFLCSRYATLLMIIIQLLPALTRIVLFTGIRTAALCNRNIWMFLLVFSLSGVLAFADLVLFIQAPIQFTSDPLTCAALSPDTRAQEIRYHFIVSLALRITNIAADAIALIVAWRKAIGSVREASRRCVRVPLSEVLIRDGDGFLAINVVQLLWDNIWHDGRPNYMVPLANMLPSILMCRFMLNLRQAANQNSKSASAHASSGRTKTTKRRAH
ncbi:hypothetical protein BDY19DRAFT_976757 [Irpex rosettiformis]|uniref:Uncharacterized protein n=1 Tax=Irpex rosettiformis TaxID=378272 RepID=A0ACB8TNT5_9APHY|nr:hypothetical protein BDY19DRAFT_976757 [Irpex rosettiformis]